MGQRYMTWQETLVTKQEKTIFNELYKHARQNYPTLPEQELKEKLAEAVWRTFNNFKASDGKIILSSVEHYTKDKSFNKEKQKELHKMFAMFWFVNGYTRAKVHIVPLMKNVINAKDSKLRFLSTAKMGTLSNIYTADTLNLFKKVFKLKEAKTKKTKPSPPTAARIAQLKEQVREKQKRQKSKSKEDVKEKPKPIKKQAYEPGLLRQVLELKLEQRRREYYAPKKTTPKPSKSRKKTTLTPKQKGFILTDKPLKLRKLVKAEAELTTKQKLAEFLKKHKIKELPRGLSYVKKLPYQGPPKEGEPEFIGPVRPPPQSKYVIGRKLKRAGIGKRLLKRKRKKPVPSEISEPKVVATAPEQEQTQTEQIFNLQQMADLIATGKASIAYDKHGNAELIFEQGKQEKTLAKSLDTVNYTSEELEKYLTDYSNVMAFYFLLQDTGISKDKIKPVKDYLNKLKVTAVGKYNKDLEITFLDFYNEMYAGKSVVKFVESESFAYDIDKLKIQLKGKTYSLTPEYDLGTKEETLNKFKGQKAFLAVAVHVSKQTPGSKLNIDAINQYEDILKIRINIVQEQNY